MTAKRFEEQNLENHLNRIYDAKKGKVVFDEDIVDLLNALHEENIELQGMYDAQKQLYCQLNSNKNNIWQDYQDLKKENEQLKQQIKDLRINVLDSIHEAEEIQCCCTPCVVEECVKKVIE